jgi:hypothetical protein
MSPVEGRGNTIMATTTYTFENLTVYRTQLCYLGDVYERSDYNDMDLQEAVNELMARGATIHYVSPPGCMNCLVELRSLRGRRWFLTAA